MRAVTREDYKCGFDRIKRNTQPGEKKMMTMRGKGRERESFNLFFFSYSRGVVCIW